MYPVARGKIPPPCLIGIEEAGIGRTRTAGEQAKQWFWKVVLGIQGAQERCSGNSSGPESCFGNSSGQFCGPAKSCWELNWPGNVVLGIQVARSVVQEMRFWNSSCRGKAFWEFKWPVPWSKKGAFGIQVALESRLGKSSGPFCGPRKALLDF